MSMKRKTLKITLYFPTTKNAAFSKFLFLYPAIYKWNTKICIIEFVNVILMMENIHQKSIAKSVITKLMMQIIAQKSIVKSGNTNSMINGF